MQPQLIADDDLPRVLRSRFRPRAAMFSSLSVEWRTPPSVYAALDAEFGFTLDPCPIGATDGLTRSWSGQRVYCNPPYGPDVARWLAKAVEAELAVYLLPARTDTRWFHDLVVPCATEIRFVRGRLLFAGSPSIGRAPFPSVVVIFQ